MTLFESMERYGRDTVNGGYIEARAFDWSDIDDFRLSEKEINCPKSMNTNLHVLEAYTTLTHACRSQAGENDHVRQALIELTKITLEKIVNSEWRFELFFEMDWKSLSHISNGYEISYGHDIEGSWLLYEAALATNDKEIIAETKQAALSIAEAVLASAIDHKNGGLFGSCNAAGIIHDKKDWWSQAEAVVGFYNAYELSGKQTFLDTAASIWEYIKNNFTDYSNGEWHSELNPDNTPDKTMPKAGFWKCPYHNSRACFEMIRRGNR
jgi:mannobiose 2-epimerase